MVIERLTDRPAGVFKQSLPLSVVVECRRKKGNPTPPPQFYQAKV